MLGNLLRTIVDDERFTREIKLLAIYLIKESCLIMQTNNVVATETTAVLLRIIFRPEDINETMFFFAQWPDWELIYEENQFNYFVMHTMNTLLRYCIGDTHGDLFFYLESLHSLITHNINIRLKVDLIKDFTNYNGLYEITTMLKTR